MIVDDPKKYQEGSRYPHNSVVNILAYFISVLFLGIYTYVDIFFYF